MSTTATLDLLLRSTQLVVHRLTPPAAVLGATRSHRALRWAGSGGGPERLDEGVEFVVVQVAVEQDELAVRVDAVADVG